MAQLAKEEIDRLWNDMGYVKSWSSLSNVLQQHRKEGQEMDSKLVEHLLRETNDIQATGQAFPESSDQLFTVLQNRAKEKQID